MHSKCGTLSTVLKNKLLNFFFVTAKLARVTIKFSTRARRRYVLRKGGKHNVGRAHHREMRMRFILSTLNETWLASNIVRGN